MKKRISVLLLAAALTFGLTCGGTTFAQPPQPGEHMQGNPASKPEMKGPDGGNFKRPDGQRLEKEMRDNFRPDKKDFQDRGNHGKKDFKKGNKHNNKKRGNGKDFRPGEHKNRPDFNKSGHDPRPGDHQSRPDLGQPRN